MDATTLNLDVPADIVTRIVAAANQLFEECGKSTLPNVDSVRRKAHVNMNDASKVMRAWRKAQSEAAVPVPHAIPKRVRDAGQALMQSLWKEASELANSSLSAAQAGWESERVEAEGFRAQLAAAFDQQSNEMQSLQTALRDALAANDVLQRSANTNAQERTSLLTRLDSMTADAKHAQDRSSDLQQHIDDVRTVLTRVQEQAVLASNEGARAAEAASTEIRGLHAELLRSAERLAAATQETAVLRSEMKLLAKQAPTKRSGTNRPAPATGTPSVTSPPKRSGNGKATG